MLFLKTPKTRSLLEMFTPGTTVEKLCSIRYQIKTNSFLAQQRKAGVELKRINWIAFVREKASKNKKKTLGDTGAMFLFAGAY